MAIQINSALTTRSGFAVPAGAYTWLQEERAKDNKYSVRVDLLFFKDKASFDAGKQRFIPQELPENLHSFYQEFTAANYANLTSVAVHNYVRNQLEAVLGVGTTAIVQ
jgi:hypothetical protein